MKHKSIRIILSILAKEDLELENLDVKIAFLHGKLEEDLFRATKDVRSHQEPPLVCKLGKSLYGLKQSPRRWYKIFDHFMVKHDYKRSVSIPKHF